MMLFALNQVSAVDFDLLIDYDNKCFITPNFGPRRDFLRRWTQVVDGSACVALNSGSSSSSKNAVVGFGCRRPAIQQNNHIIGPLYANDERVAERILRELMSGVKDGDTVHIEIWSVIAYSIIEH